jgi:phage terminase small subunit
MAKFGKGGLTERQTKFVDAFLATRDAKKAGIAIGYSEKTASARGSAMLAVPAVADKIAEKSLATTKRAEVDAQFVINELRRVAEQDDVAQGTKVRALELLAKHLGLLEDRITVKTDGLSPEQRAERVAILLERVRTRD